MDEPLKFYAKVLGLLAVLTAVIGFNFAVWGLHRHPTPPALYVAGADAERGRGLFEEYGCGACHTVPGLRSAVGQVGPPLDRMKERVYIAGMLPNSAAHLSQWIQHPRQVNPRTAMPALGVSEPDARAIAAYLYAQP